MIKAVIFDLDGVISDTQILHEIAEAKALKKYGISMTLKQIRKEFTGIPDSAQFEKAFKRSNVNANIKEAVSYKYTQMPKITRNNIKFIDGSINFIKKLKQKKIRLAVASSAPKHFIELILKFSKIKKLFDAIISTEEVKKGKPNPDIFLYAAKKIKAKPQDCVVIEDAPNGVKAAKLAKMKVVGITTTHSKKQLEQADLVVNSFKELILDKILNL